MWFEFFVWAGISTVAYCLHRMYRFSIPRRHEAVIETTYPNRPDYVIEGFGNFPFPLLDTRWAFGDDGNIFVGTRTVSTQCIQKQEDIVETGTEVFLVINYRIQDSIKIRDAFQAGRIPVASPTKPPCTRDVDEYVRQQVQLRALSVMPKLSKCGEKDLAGLKIEDMNAPKLLNLLTDDGVVIERVQVAQRPVISGDKVYTELVSDMCMGEVILNRVAKQTPSHERSKVIAMLAREINNRFRESDIRRLEETETVEPSVAGVEPPKPKRVSFQPKPKAGGTFGWVLKSVIGVPWNMALFCCWFFIAFIVVSLIIAGGSYSAYKVYNVFA